MTRRERLRPLGTSLVVVISATLAAAPGIAHGSAVDSSHRVLNGVGGSVHLMAESDRSGMGLTGVQVPLPGSWSAPPPGDELIGPASAVTTVPFTVTLQSQDPAGLAAQVTAVSTPSSPEYRHFLTPAEFASRFGASSGEITAVSQVLRSEGLAVGQVAATGLSLVVRGTIAQIDAAFSTSLLAYREPSGARGYDPASSLSVPAAIAPDVMGVIGLDTLNRSAPLLASGLGRARTPLLAHAAALPSLASAPTANANCSNIISGLPAYSANQLAQAYSLSPLYQAGHEGAGSTIALVELAGSSYSESDLNTFASCYGLSIASNQVNFVGVDGATNTLTSGTIPLFAETELDIETALSLAPSATIDVYVGAGSTYDTLSQVVSNDTAKIVSMSWGHCALYDTASSLDSENTLFEAAALEGLSLFASSGDNGAQDCLASPLTMPLAQSGGTAVPVGQIFDPATNTLYVASDGSPAGVVVGSLAVGRAAFVQTAGPPTAIADLTATASEPTATAKVFVANGGTIPGLTVITTASCNATNTTGCSSPETLTATASGELADPTALAVDSSNSTLYVGNSGNHTVSVFNTATNTYVSQVSLPSGATPQAIVVAPNGFVFVSDASNATVDVFNGSTCNAANTTTCSSTVQQIPLGGFTNPGPMAYFPANGDLYVGAKQGYCTLNATATTLGGGVCNSQPGPADAFGLSPSGDQMLEVLGAPNPGASAGGQNTDLLVVLNPAPGSSAALMPLFSVDEQTTDTFTSLVSVPNLNFVMVSDATAGSDVALGLAPSASDPAEQPDVTAVGGTSLSALGPPPSESVWNLGSLGNGAGGGGISNAFPMPAYQLPLAVIPGESSGAPCGATSGYCREVPDVSADANPLTGYGCYIGGQWVAEGGTSASSPLWAAVLADIASADQNTTGFGLLNPALYHLAQTAPGVYFNDVTTGNNDLLGTNGGLYPALPGYDMATGLGTPIAAKLASGLASAPSAPTNVSAVAGDGSATVSWSAPASDGGAPITGYTATASDETASSRGGQSCTASGTSCAVTGLQNGDVYTFSVTATNQVGTGPSSTPSSAITPSAPVVSGGGQVLPPSSANANPPSQPSSLSSSPQSASPSPSASSPASLPPLPSSITRASFGKAKSDFVSTTGTTTLADTVGAIRATVDVPGGALPAGTEVTVRPVEQVQAIDRFVPGPLAYVTSFAVSWVTEGGSAPHALVPLSMTITDPAIRAGAVVYELTAVGKLLKVGVATTNGRVVIHFSSDPDFIVTSAPEVALASRRAAMTVSRIALPLSCVTGRSCEGTARLSVVRIALRHGERVKVHVVLAGAAFRIAAGHRVALGLKITRAGASIFDLAKRDHRRFRATLLTRLTDGGRMVLPVFLTLPKSRPNG